MRRLLPWQRLDSETVYTCKVFSLRRDRSRSPRTGDDHDFFVLEAGDWVNIVPITADDRVVMIRQYRHGISDFTLEVPGGMVDAEDASPLVAARREMIEETGYDSEDIVARYGDASCITAVASNESEERAYLDLVLTAAQASNMDLVTWWSNRDLVPAKFMTDCPCTFDPSWCTIVDIFRGAAPANAGPAAQFYAEIFAKAFGTMGIRRWDGAPKGSVFARWQEARAIALAGSATDQ